MVRRVLSAGAVLLAGFHLWLFAGQFWSGELVDLAVLSRWIIAAGLTAALLNLHRRGLSLVRGRHAVAVWLLAGLLHSPAIARGIDAVAPSMPEVVAAVVQTVTGLAAIGSLLLLTFSFDRRRPGAPAWRRLSAFEALHHCGRFPDSFPQFAPRPPPASTPR